MATTDGDSTQTSRSRLMMAGKTLFAINGYEQTSTSAIAREAGSSESQLMRYFGGKAGLLEAIFNESWSGLNEAVTQNVALAVHGRDALIRIFGLMIAAFARDHDTAFLFLFEGRRIRTATHEVALSRGFVQFWELICNLIEQGQKDGSFRNDVVPAVLASAILGCAEGMLRDRILGERNHDENPFDEAAIQTTFEVIVNGLAGTS
jgi:TetR/AcrR family transcriptional regulator